KLNPNFSAGDNFGAAVAMNSDGTIVAVGAPERSIGQTNYCGSVLVYSRTGNTWTYEDALYQHDPAIRHNSDYYGRALAAGGNTVVVGVPWGDMGNLFNCGYIAIWDRTAGPTWTGNGFLYPGDVQGNDHFGSSVAISGDLIAVGSPDATVGGLSANGA